MSKIKTNLLPEGFLSGIDGSHIKESLRFCNRRYESRKKKRYRMKRCKNHHNCYYHIIDEKPIREHFFITEPAHEEPVYYYERVKVKKTDWNGNEYWNTDFIRKQSGTKMIPEKRRKRTRLIGYESVNPYLEKFDDGKHKKYLRTLANRKLRRRPITDTFKGGEYKKNYDLWWELY